MEMWRRLIESEKRWRAFTFAILLLGLGWSWANRVMPLTTMNRPGDAPHPGFSAPPFDLVSLDGARFDLAALKGRPIVLNFWATWCRPCRSEMPAIERVWQASAGSDLAILAVNLQEEPARVGAFAQEFELTFPILLDPHGDAQRHYQVQLYPTTFFIDRQGIIQDVVYGGPMAESLLAAKIAELVD